MLIILTSCCICGVTTYNKEEVNSLATVFE